MLAIHIFSLLVITLLLNSFGSSSNCFVLSDFADVHLDF